MSATAVEEFNVEEVFRHEFDNAIWALEIETAFPESEWFRAGIAGSQDRGWWYDHGPEMVNGFLEWFDGQDDVEVWTTPDGRPAIELELNVTFGDVPVRMFIDLILKMGSALVVVDLKSGAKTPENVNQLSIYASGVELAFGPEYRPRYGSYYMLRGVGRDEKNYFLTPFEMTGYQHSVDWWTRQFAMLDKGIQSGVFVANVGEHCKRCGVADACPAVGGRDASRWDAGFIEWKGAN